MSRRRYKSQPDGGVLDVDHDSIAPGHRRAAFISGDSATDRASERAGARELDVAVEQMPGLTRARKDRERAMPLPTNAPLGHPLKERRLLGVGVERKPLSSRQRKDRSIARRAVTAVMPRTERAAVRGAITDEDQWKAINDDLAEVVGDATQLDDSRRVEVQRIDRAIQRYERVNDRGHVIYANLELPPAINHSNLGGFLHNEFQPGDVLSFDRYTGAAHTMHQIESAPGSAERMAVLEIQTRRGIYLGTSDSIDNTSHLLPRGVQLEVVGTQLATFRRPDGATGQRHVIQLRDVSNGHSSNSIGGLS
jgi:hypothetical protein